jgi:dephospho-CoA kinase
VLTLNKVAVTGVLGSGKSTVCRLFKEEGATVVDSDELVHKLLSSNSQCIKAVVELLGKDIYTGETIDRKKVADQVFKDQKKLKELEQILHPAVLNEIERLYAETRPGLFVAEVPLLFESGCDKFFHTTVAVVCDETTAITRYGNPTEFHRRMARQLSQEEKAKKAHHVIVNQGSVEDLKAQVKELLNQWKMKRP